MYMSDDSVNDFEDDFEDEISDDEIVDDGEGIIDESNLDSQSE